LAIQDWPINGFIFVKLHLSFYCVGHL